MPPISTLPLPVPIRFQQVIFALFAGFDTTSVTLARMLQLLGSAGGKKVAEELVEELNHRTAVDGENTPGGASKSAERSSPGVFGAFPLLEAVVLESSRFVCRCPRGN